MGDKEVNLRLGWCVVLFVMAALSFSVASVVEDVLQQHGTRLKDLDLESRKAEEAGNFPLFFWDFVKIQFLNFGFVAFRCNV